MTSYIVMCAEVSTGMFATREQWGLMEVVDGQAKVIATAVDEATARRCACLLNRFGMEDVPLPEGLEQ